METPKQSAANRREQEEARARKLGAGGGEYARLHTARGDRWYIVVGSFHFPREGESAGFALGPIWERVSASSPSFAAIAAERKIRKGNWQEYDALIGMPVDAGALWITESVAEEVFRREP